MTDIDTSAANEETRAAWNTNAAFWDQYMGDKGNDFVNLLIWPPTERLLALQPGERVLDVACGNGLYALRLAALGAEVVAFDFSEEMVHRAQERGGEYKDRITYHVVDATDFEALLALGEGQFDAAACQMALMDIAEIAPLYRGLARLLRPGGRFVFSLTHPSFNNATSVHLGEMEDREGKIVTTYSVKIRRYMTPSTAHGVAINGQPAPQLYFDRPLQDVLRPAFAAGSVLDALEERAFPPDHPTGRNPLIWNGNFSEIPPVLVARLRLFDRTRMDAERADERG